MVEWASRNWGNVASVLGFALTVYVMFVTRGARRAAEQARNAIERRSAAADRRAGGERVTFLKILCDSQRWEIGAHIADQIAQELTFVQSRWKQAP